MRYQLIAFDMDGTLLDSNKKNSSLQSRSDFRRSRRRKNRDSIHRPLSAGAERIPSAAHTSTLFKLRQRRLGGRPTDKHGNLQL